MEISQHFCVSGETPDAGPDAIKRVPSSHNLDCPYYGLIKRTFWNVVDLSSHISKGDVNSGVPGTSFNDVLNDYHFAVAGGFPQLPEEPGIAVVDDVFQYRKNHRRNHRTVSATCPGGNLLRFGLPLADSFYDGPTFAAWYPNRYSAFVDCLPGE